MTTRGGASPLLLSRVTGALYLVIIVCAGFAEGYVRSGLKVSGDGAATAENILAAQSLFRLGFAADLVAFMADAAVTVLLYVLLRPAGRTLSLLAAAFRLLAHPAIAAVNLLNHFAALRVLTGGAFPFEADRAEALAVFFLDLHRQGYLLGGAFFGVHCLLLGILIHRSGRLPRILGILMAAAAAGYLTESFGNFLVPGHEAVLSWIVALPAAVAELSLALWLLIRGMNASMPGSSESGTTGA